MVKRFVVYSLPDGTDPDEFWRYHTEEHSEHFKKIVGTKLRKYVMNRVTAQVGGDIVPFAFIETVWESEEAMEPVYAEAQKVRLPNGKTIFEDFMSRINLHFAGSVEEKEIEI